MTSNDSLPPDYEWVCEFCFEKARGAILPEDWLLVWGCAVCPVCHRCVEQDGGYMVVPGGAYAGDALDPRALKRLEARP